MEARGVKVLGPAAAPLARLKARVSLPVFAEVAEAQRGLRRGCGVLGVLRGEEDSGAGRAVGRGPGELVVTPAARWDNKTGGSSGRAGSILI